MSYRTFNVQPDFNTAVDAGGPRVWTNPPGIQAGKGDVVAGAFLSQPNNIKFNHQGTTIRFDRWPYSCGSFWAFTIGVVTASITITVAPSVDNLQVVWNGAKHTCPLRLSGVVSFSQYHLPADFTTLPEWRHNSYAKWNPVNGFIQNAQGDVMVSTFVDPSDTVTLNSLVNTNQIYAPASVWARRRRCAWRRGRGLMR